MSTTTAIESVQPEVVAAPALPRPVKPWLFGPWVDLFFLANLAWPIVVLAAVFGAGLSTWADSPIVQSITFWQIYFISTPHRWITLSLVYLDEEKFQQRPAAFVGIGIFFILFVTAVVIKTNSTLLLVAIDYFWNAWHFAAQHSGISRIYARQARPEEVSRGMWEKFLLRTFILFVIFRAGALACAPTCTDSADMEHPALVRHTSFFTFGMSTEALQEWVVAFITQAERWMDAALITLPILLLAVEIYRFRPSCWGRLAYLASVITAYCVLLYAVHQRNTVLTLAVALSISLFHATEYLAIVSWAVIKKHSKSTQGAFAHLVPRWGLALGTFIAVLGLSGWLLGTHFANAWIVLTIAVSYLHYAYDGMIWKARKPAAAKAA
jgi:hypothetical protein